MSEEPIGPVPPKRARLESTLELNPLFILPKNPLIEIFKGLTMVDILTFAMTSSHSQTLLDTIRFHSIRIEIRRSKSHQFFIVAPGKTTLKINFVHLPSAQMTGRLFGIPVARTIFENVDMFLESKVIYWTMEFDENSNREQVWRRMAHLVMRVFECPKVLFKADDGDTRQLRYFVNNVHNRFKLVRVVFENTRSIGEEEMRALMEDVDVDEFRFCCFPHPLEYPRALSHRKMNVTCARWLRIHHVLNMKCSAFIAIDSPLTAEDLNRFLKRWRSGRGLRELHKCSFEHAEHFDHLQMARVVEGIARIGWRVPMRPLRVHKKSLVDFQRSVYIQRADGLLGSLLVSSGKLELFVWHRLYMRNAEGLTIKEEPAD